MPRSTYVVAVGSNKRGRHGAPRAEVAAALALLDGPSGAIIASPIVDSAPLGPSTRMFANAVALLASDESPPALLARLKAIERAFGRRRGQRWAARVIDLDIIVWTGGRWRSRSLTIPHRDFAKRRFVLDPLLALAPQWRDPVTNLTMRQLHARLTAPRAMPRPRHAGEGP